ncbi:DUF2339 domain-containing protein [Rhodobacteraceae bacterium 63075]|nr:DUF2339 domain-containing protein [Rhodobacteraceae bacterium 63075]
MEPLLIVLAIAFFGLVVIGVPVALIRIGSLQRQITQLRADMTRVAPHAPAETPKPEADGAAEPEDTQPQEASAARPARPAATPASEVAPVASTPAANPPVPPQREDSEPPKAFVFTQNRFDELAAWLKENWVLAIAAASLAFAGLFMVQYGVEHGVLTPFWRVMAALGFGAVLVAGGEALRRRHGDDGADGDHDMRYLPSALSGAGIIVLFAAVLAARHLYEMIGPGTSLAGLCVVAALAIVIGWFYGPALAAIGIVGAGAAPFVVGGASDAPWLFYYYFLLIAVMALGIDTVKRWAWISVLGLFVGLGGMWLLYLGGAGTLHFAFALLLGTLAALTIPVRSLVPDHGDAAFWQMRAKAGGKAKLPGFPTRLAGGAILNASVAGLLIVMANAGIAEVWLGFGLLLVLAAALLLWASGASALQDQAVLPAGAFLLALCLHGMERGLLVRELMRGVTAEPDITMPQTQWGLYVLVAMGVLLSLMAFWRMARAAGAQSGTEAQAAVGFALGAAILAPGVFFILEFTWPAVRVLGTYPWALTAMALAALMTLLAERAARGGDADGRRKLRVALLAIAALTLIAMALFLLLTKTALSLALAAMIVLIVLIDRKFDLPVLGGFIQIGVAVITYRLVLDPGFFWAVDHDSAFEVFVAYAGVIALLAGAWWLYGGAGGKHPLRLGGRLAVESAVWLIALVGAAVALVRIFEDDIVTHWGLGLLALIAGASILVQAHRLPASRWLPVRVIRFALMGLSGLAMVLLLGMQASIASPLVNFLSTGSNLVLGPPLLDSLALAYLPLAMLFAFAAKRFVPDRRLGYALYALSGLYAVTYLVFEVRRLVRGRDLSVPGVTDAELYVYTVLMLVASVGLLLYAYLRRSTLLRKIAMAGVALTIAKVFLVDMSGLAGLTRVFSFMGLGLSLLGLVWLNRKLDAGWGDGGDDGAGPAPAPGPEPEPETGPDPEPSDAPEKPKARPVRPAKDD